MDYNRKLFGDCITGTAVADGKPNLEAAFERYLAESKACGLHIPEIRAFNPRILAARAFDFTVWMGFFSGMPTVQPAECEVPHEGIHGNRLYLSNSNASVIRLSTDESKACFGNVIR